MARIIALCNQKGGTGKTTTAINLSTAIAMAGKRVLLIDLDPQANTTSGVGIDKHNLTQNIYHVLIEEYPISKVLVSTFIPKMSILPAGADLTGAEIELVEAQDREYRLKKAIEQDNIKDEFEFIFIDSPPSLGLLTLNGLTSADSVLIPVQCEYYALEGLSQLMNTITLVQKNLNPELVIEGVLLTMADFRTNLTAEVIKEVRSYFKDKAYRTVIPRNIRLSEAPSFGRPIFVYDKTSIGAIKYWELAGEILKLNLTQPIEITNVIEKEPQVNPNPIEGDRGLVNSQEESPAPIGDVIN